MRRARGCEEVTCTTNHSNKAPVSPAPFLQPLPAGLGVAWGEGRAPALPWGEAPWRDRLSPASSFAAPPPRRPARITDDFLFARNRRYGNDVRCDVTTHANDASCGGNGSGRRRCGSAAAWLTATKSWHAKDSCGHADRVWHDDASALSNRSTHRGHALRALRV